MRSSLRTLAAVLCIILIAVCTVMVFQAIVGRTRIDLTQNRLYTLSKGTRHILGELNQPIKLELYYARTAAMKGPEQIRFYNNYYLYVRDLLEEYVRLSDGNLSLEVIDPRPFSDEEQAAIDRGMKRLRLSDTESFFFGLAARTELGKQKVIAFFEPERQEFVEYDVSKLISSVIRRDKKKVGVLSSLPVMGADMSPYMLQMMRMQGRTPPPPWTIIQQLRDAYEVVTVDKEAEEVDPDIDFLMVVHPKDLAEKTLFAIDQFVMQGGGLVVFVDPHCMLDQPQQDPMNRFAAMNHRAASDLNGLLEKWGVTMVPDTIAADRALALKISAGDAVEPLVTFLGLDDRCVNPDEVVTGKLHSIRMIFPGVLRKTGVKDVTVEPLLSTTATGSTWKPEQPWELTWPVDPRAISRKVLDGAAPVMLACRITGTLKTNFPQGLTVEEDDAADDESDTDGAASRPTSRRMRTIEAVQQTPEEATVLVVADVDFMADMLAYQDTFFGMSQVGNNADLVLNAVEFLGGAEDLISIRSRGKFERPFKVVQEIEAAAEKETADEVDKINEQIKAFEKRLTELGDRTTDGNVKLVQNEVLKERDNLHKQIRASKTERRRLNDRKRRKIEALKARLLYYNLFLTPAVVLVFAIVLGVRRLVMSRSFGSSGRGGLTNRQLALLAAVTVVLLLITVPLYSVGGGPRSAFVSGSPLIQGLDPDRIHRIVIRGDDTSVTLKRQGAGFTVADRGNYPASLKDINDLIVKCLEIRLDEEVTASSDNYAELDVDPDTGDAVSVAFYDDKGDTIIGFVKGKYAESGGGVYLRLVGGGMVYRTESSIYVDTRPVDYIDRNLVKVEKADVVRVEVAPDTGPAYVIARDDADTSQVRLLDIPEGKQAKGSDYEDVFNALSSLDMDDVAPVSEKKGLVWDAEYRCRLKSGLAYTVRLAKRDGDHWVRLSASAPPPPYRPREDETDTQLKRKEVILKAREEAARINARQPYWVYQISSWNAGKMRKPLADLIEDIPPPPEDEGDTAPKEIAASHILIGYKGAERSEATRTKAEAKARADEVLKKATAEGADFAALAKEYSDGPSKTKGGDLGTFDRNTMAKPFTEAAFKLKVGEISGLVETKFGFHIIKRTK